MSETKQISLLEQTIVDVINKSVTSIEKGAEFLAGQLPDIAQQYLQWKFTWAGVELVLMLFTIFLVWVPLLRWSIKRWKAHKKQIDEYNAEQYPDKYSSYRRSYNVDTYWFPFRVIATLTTIFCSVGVFANIHTLVYIYVAPKVYLIAWARSFL